MHKLSRGLPPKCLSNYKHGKNHWNDLNKQDRIEIWEKLGEMQGQRCAYCEQLLTDRKCHIEHFKQRGRFPQYTFHWPNLFGSCNRKDSCGHYKDAGVSYDSENLLKPDTDNPDDFLVFVSDGTIIPRENLTVPQLEKAQETLRILNINNKNGPLREMRRQAVSGYIDTAEFLWEARSLYPEDEWLEIFNEELEKISHLPFITAIRHTFSRII